MNGDANLSDFSNVMLIPQVKPPFKPVVKSDTDVSNFDEDFTSEPVKLSPTEGKATDHERLSSNIHI